MLSLEAVARPYALAAFSYAKKNQQIAAWQALLESAASLTTILSEKHLLNKRLPLKSLYHLYADILKPLLNTERKNFLHLLVLHDRLAALPSVFPLFKALVAQSEKLITVRVLTACPLSEADQAKLIAALTESTQSQIVLNIQLDPSVLAGLILYIGDRVIDGSIRGRLTRLLEFSLR